MTQAYHLVEDISEAGQAEHVEKEDEEVGAEEEGALILDAEDAHDPGERGLLAHHNREHVEVAKR